MKKCKTCDSEIAIQKHKTIKIPEMKIEVETKIHKKGKKLSEIKIPPGWRLIKYTEVISLHNNKKYRKALNLDNTWEYIEQPFELNKEKGYVAGLDADSGRAFLYCCRYPLNSDPTLGVRFVRDLKKGARR